MKTFTPRANTGQFISQTVILSAVQNAAKKQGRKEATVAVVLITAFAAISYALFKSHKN